MPFNDKGEFIRETTAAARSTKPRQSVGTIGASQQPALTADEAWAVIKGLGALAILAGVIWLVVVFREWIAIGATLWLVSWIRSWLR